MVDDYENLCYIVFVKKKQNWRGFIGRLIILMTGKREANMLCKRSR